jgi:hypothetical protein
VSHVNAELTPRARLRLARLVVDRGWTYSAAARTFMVAARTARLVGHNPGRSHTKIISKQDHQWFRWL